MKEYLKVLNFQLEETVQIIRTNLSENDRKKFNSVLIVDVHSRDVVEGFVNERFKVYFI